MKAASLRDIGEFGLIERIAKRSKKKDASVLVGIGDDAAVITPPSPLAKEGMGGRTHLLITTDTLVEDVHFLRYYPPEALGWKALSVNISDIAAMGGIPRYYLLSLSVPIDISSEYLDRLCAGMSDAAKVYDLTLIGGDTTSSPDKIYISITVLGETSNNALLRRGARPGDAIFVTGTLGDSALGRKILEETVKVRRGETEKMKKVKIHRFTDSPIHRFLIDRHLRPTPRVKEGISLAKSGMATSMIDISDGLLADLGHICEESKVGARVRMDKIPLSSGFKAVSAGYGGIELALSGGEDYELLFTVSGDDVDIFLKGVKGIKCTRIGEIVKGRGVAVDRGDGLMYLPKGRGYEHFKG